jgi:hypothetical protein
MGFFLGRDGVGRFLGDIHRGIDRMRKKRNAGPSLMHSQPKEPTAMAVAMRRLDPRFPRGLGPLAGSARGGQ